MCAKRILDSSAAFWASVGRTKHCGTKQGWYGPQHSRPERSVPVPQSHSSLEHTHTHTHTPRGVSLTHAHTLTHTHRRTHHEAFYSLTHRDTRAHTHTHTHT